MLGFCFLSFTSFKYYLFSLSIIVFHSILILFREFFLLFLFTVYLALYLFSSLFTSFPDHLLSSVYLSFLLFSEAACRSPSKGAAARRRRAWCGCLSGPEEPPEITYCVADGVGGGLSLQAITPTTPMPEEEELNAKFAELVVSNCNLLYTVHC